MKKEFNPSRDIEWGNHFVSFLSAMLGIFIALQLGDWKEDQIEKERSAESLNAIKAEVDSNMAIMRYNIRGLRGQVECLAFYRLHLSDKKVLVNPEVLNRMKEKYPKRFRNASPLKIRNDSIIEIPFDPMIDFLPRTGITSAAWQSAALTGAMSRFEQNTTSGLAQIYDWTNKDLGFSDADFFSKIILHDDDDKEISDPATIEKNYKRLAIIYSRKLEFMEAAYRKISWEVR
jgi:hypothetical protein